MLNKKATLSQIDSMPIEELMSKFRSALDKSQISYEDGRGTIVWDGLPQVVPNFCVQTNVVVSQKRKTGRKYCYSACNSWSAKNISNGYNEKISAIVVA